VRTALRRVLRTAALVPLIALAGCGGDDLPDPAAASSSATETSEAEPTPAPDLASGLLPADAFGPEASVVAVSREQLQQRAALALAQAEGVQVTPEECAVAVAGTQLDFDDFEDVAAQTATVRTANVVEVLLRDGPVEEMFDQLAGAAERCPSAQVTAPGVGQSSIEFWSPPTADLGDGSTLLGMYTEATLPDGTQAIANVFIGAVMDGDRLLLMINVDASTGLGAWGVAPDDPDVFNDILEGAYEAQADALD
jgi:hypothetical protein